MLHDFRLTYFIFVSILSYGSILDSNYSAYAAGTTGSTNSFSNGLTAPTPEQLPKITSSAPVPPTADIGAELARYPRPIRSSNRPTHTNQPVDFGHPSPDFEINALTAVGFKFPSPAPISKENLDPLGGKPKPLRNPSQGGVKSQASALAQPTPEQIKAAQSQ